MFVLYGKWRPRGFDELVGQDHIVTTLRNALATGQVAHAYLFSGPRGTGKTTTARILARAVNCANLRNGEPCNACPACDAIGRGAALDLIEMDAASNRGIDDVRALREKIAFAPSDLKMKVYLLDEVHMLTDGAWNALLKTLEEPPPHAIFILATTEYEKVPATVLSRCQRYDFHRVANEAIVARLRYIAAQEGFAVPDDGLLQIAIQSRGGMRDAITLLEQVVARCGPSPSTAAVLDALGLVHDERSEQLALTLVAGDLATALDLARAVADDGVDITRFTRATVDLLREALPQVLRHQPLPASPARALVEAALENGGAAAVARAIQELAAADFRQDPASAVPLEVACAAAVLAPVAVAVAAAAPAATPSTRRSRPEPSSAERSSSQANGRELSPGERLIKELYRRCSGANYKLGAHLNASCEVLQMDGDVLELGFYYRPSMEKIASEGRALVEQHAGEILGRVVRLEVRQIERRENARPAARRGHLAEAARALGAIPVGKEE